jgi:hypothetical protein
LGDDFFGLIILGDGMNKRGMGWMAVVLMGAMAGPLLAQAAEGDNRPPPPRRGDAGDRPNPPGPRDDSQEDGPRRGGDNQDGPPRRNGGAVPPVGEAAAPQVRAMMGYLQLVDQYKHLTADSTAAGVAAVVTAGDILRHKGPKAAIEYFEKVLPTVKSVSVRNAIHLQLADFYRASGDDDKALEHLTALMTTAASGPEDVAYPEEKKK